MAKVTKSVRMSDATIGQLKELTELLKESEADLIERAVNLLYKNRKAIYEQDVEERRRKLSN